MLSEFSQRERHVSNCYMSRNFSVSFSAPSFSVFSFPFIEKWVPCCDAHHVVTNRGTAKNCRPARYVQN